MSRLDRYGEPVEDDDKPDFSLNGRQPPLNANDPHDPRCRAGWLGDDEHDHPIPCLQCRPHLKRTT
jgi:hypothetical protein